MSIDVWWVVLIGVVCFLAGIAITLVGAAFLVTTPVDGRTNTGDLGALEDDP